MFMSLFNCVYGLRRRRRRRSRRKNTFSISICIHFYSLHDMRWEIQSASFHIRIVNKPRKELNQLNKPQSTKFSFFYNHQGRDVQNLQFTQQSISNIHTKVQYIQIRVQTTNKKATIRRDKIKLL